jgi:hypothetical protein
LIVHNEFILAGQTLNSAYYCDILRQLHENVQKLHPKLWQQKKWLLHHDKAPTHTSFFTREVLTKNNMTAPPHPPYYSASPIEDKTERPTILTQLRWLKQNCLTEHNFQDEFKKWQKLLEWCICVDDVCG